MPNIGFWKVLPKLVFTGCVVTGQCIKGLFNRKAYTDDDGLDHELTETTDKGFFL